MEGETLSRPVLEIGIMSKAKARITVLGAMTVLIVIDQITKIAAQQYLQFAGVRSFGADVFRLTYAENSGVFLGLGRALPESMRFWLFTLAVGLVLTAILIDTMRSPAPDRWRLYAIIGILAGGFGNLVDRILRNGIVVDFMNMGIGGLRTGIFNVADMLITGGALLFLYLEFFRPKPMEQQASKNPAPEEATT